MQLPGLPCCRSPSSAECWTFAESGRRVLRISSAASGGLRHNTSSITEPLGPPRLPSLRCAIARFAALQQSEMVHSHAIAPPALPTQRMQPSGTCRCPPSCAAACEILDWTVALLTTAACALQHTYLVLRAYDEDSKEKEKQVLIDGEARSVVLPVSLP